mgnify:CR=1 FL=1
MKQLCSMVGKERRNCVGLRWAYQDLQLWVSTESFITPSVSLSEELQLYLYRMGIFTCRCCPYSFTCTRRNINGSIVPRPGRSARSHFTSRRSLWSISTHMSGPLPRRRTLKLTVTWSISIQPESVFRWAVICELRWQPQRPFSGPPLYAKEFVLMLLVSSCQLSSWVLHSSQQ